MRLVGLFLVAAFLSFFAVPQAALAWDGYVVRVEDSNCIAVADEPNSKEVRARLFFYGIQAPTGKQPMAAQAMAFLQQVLPPGTPVSVDEAGHDHTALGIDEFGFRILCLQCSGLAHFFDQVALNGNTAIFQIGVCVVASDQAAISQKIHNHSSPFLLMRCYSATNEKRL